MDNKEKSITGRMIAVILFFVGGVVVLFYGGAARMSILSGYEYKEKDLEEDFRQRDRYATENSDIIIYDDTCLYDL